MTTIVFANSRPYIGNRPYVDVILNPSHSASPNHLCLADTGADYLQLPAIAAALCGLSLAAAAPHSVRLASGGGSVPMLKLSGVAASIEGHPVTIDVLFDPTNSPTPIAGRTLLLAAFDVGFDPAQFLWP